MLGAACLPAASAMGAETAAPPGLDGFRIARRHKIVRTVPTPAFFEGMLLGNGDIGVCITVRTRSGCISENPIRGISG